MQGVLFTLQPTKARGPSSALFPKIAEPAATGNGARGKCTRAAEADPK